MQSFAPSGGKTSKAQFFGGKNIRDGMRGIFHDDVQLIKLAFSAHPVFITSQIVFISESHTIVQLHFFYIFSSYLRSLYIFL